VLDVIISAIVSLEARALLSLRQLLGLRSLLLTSRLLCACVFALSLVFPFWQPSGSVALLFRAVG
jgi:hypothetical protein